MNTWKSCAIEIKIEPIRKAQFDYYHKNKKNERDFIFLKKY